MRSLGSAEVRALPPLRRICKMTNSPDESTTVAVILAKSPSLGLTIPEDTSFQHWLAVGKHLALADNALAWRVGDWWIYGEHRYGDRIAVLRRGGRSGPGFGACRNYADQISDHDEAGGDAETHIQRLLCGEPADRVDDRETG